MHETSQSSWKEHDGFLEAIHRDPDADDLRLIYADWLEDRGDGVWTALAELVRVQIGMARIKSKTKRRKSALARREQELLSAHQDAWLGPWAGGTYRWIFHRGIPTGLVAHARAFWIGRRLDRDMGFQDWINLHDEGMMTVVYGDPNWGDVLMGSVHGTYQLQFTYAQPRVHVELWGVGGRTLRYEGHLGTGGRLLVLEEQTRKGTSQERITLPLGPPQNVER